MAEFLKRALQPPALRRTVRIAFVVGTLASVVNQGSVIASGGATIATWVRVAINYVMPFFVSSLGYVAALRRSGPAEEAAVKTAAAYGSM